MAKEYIFIGRSFDGFDKDGKRKSFGNGEKVTLSDEQYEAFKDQFTLPDAPKVAPKVATEEKKDDTNIGTTKV